MIAGITVSLRWPYSYSPNAGRRLATAARSGHEAEDRRRAREAVLSMHIDSAILDGLKRMTDGVACDVYLYAPDKRHRDTQTGAIVTKSAMDGVCSGLGIDDLMISDFSVHRRQAVSGGRLDVVLSWTNDP